MSFLDGYEDVAARIRRLHATFPDNKVHTAIIDFNAEKGFVLVECRIYRHYDDLFAAGIDFAYGHQSAYNANMKRWFVEDTITSAIGRCAGLVLGSETRPTKQNMEHVEAISKEYMETDLFPASDESIEKVKSQLSSADNSEAPICLHGHRILREGISPKNGKPYRGHTCPEKNKESQCEAIWYSLSPEGTWKIQH